MLELLELDGISRKMGLSIASWLFLHLPAVGIGVICGPSLRGLFLDVP